MGTKLLGLSACHPQTDGLIERASQTVEQMLRGVVDANHTEWDEHLDLVEFAYKNSSQASTGHGQMCCYRDKLQSDTSINLQY